MNNLVTILTGDWIEQLKTLPDECCQMCVTSPPYWNLRDYQMDAPVGMRNYEVIVRTGMYQAGQFIIWKPDNLTRCLCLATFGAN